MSASRALLGAVAGGLGAWVGAAAVIDGSAPPAADGDADLVVVLGCRPLPDGRASYCLFRRTERAVALWQAGRAPRLALCGGSEAGGPTEAAVARKVALRLGVPEDAVVVEQASTSTRENAVFLHEQVGDVSILVVTDPSHAWRAGKVFGRLFPEVGVVTTELPWSARAWMALREVPAVGWYAWEGWW